MTATSPGAIALTAAAARRSIPTFDCKLGCHDCCGLVPFSDAEKQAAMKRRPLEQWERFSAESWVPKAALDTFRCPFLTATGCGIYDDRPMVCRLFGAVDHPMMTCPKGCGPERKLSDVQSRALIRGVEAVACHCTEGR